MIKKYFVNSDSRTTKMNMNILVMFVVRGLSILISLLYVPLLLKSIDRTDYGILITLTSIVGWVGMLDIGLGNGLRNKLAISIANNDYYSAKKYVSSTYAAIGLYMGVIIIIFLTISPFLSWSNILNADISKANELYSLANIVFVLFAINFVLGILNSILFSYQLPSYQSVIGLVSQLIGFIIVYIAIKFYGITSILIIGIITTIISPIVLLAFSVFLFLGKFKAIAPSLRMIKLSAVQDIISLGIKFFILQVITIVLFQVNNIIISHIVNPDAVVEYNIAYRYIDVIAIIFTIMVTPVWSASTEAYARNDFNWIKKTVKILRLTTFIVFSLGVLMLIFSKYIFNIWLGKGEININYYTTGMVLAFVLFRMLYQCYGFVINGTGKVKAQMIFTLFIAMTYIPVAILLGKQFGLLGILFVSALSQFLNFIWSRYQYLKLISGTATGIWNK